MRALLREDREDVDVEDMPTRRLPSLPWWLISGAVGLGAAAMYATTLSAAWSWMDDWLMLQVGTCFSDAVHGAGAFSTCFDDPVAGRIRPGMFVYYAVTSMIFGMSAVAHQVFRLLLLVAITLGVGGTAWRFTQSRGAVAISSALFAFMPLCAGNWDKLGPTDVPALLLFVWAVFLVAGPDVPRLRTAWGAVLLTTAAALTKEPLSLMNIALAGYLYWRGFEAPKVRRAATGMMALSGVVLVAGLGFNLVEEHSYVQQVMGLDLVEHLGTELSTLRTGLFLPAFLLLCVIMFAEVVAYRGDAVTVIPWPALAFSVAAAIAGWGHLLITPDPQTRYVVLGMLPAAWIPALLWPLLPRRHTASRVMSALVAAHYIAAGMLTLPDVDVKEAEWRMTRALTQLPDGMRVGLVEVSDMQRPRVLGRVLSSTGKGPAVQPWTLENDAVMVTARTSDVRKEWLRKCGGRALFYTSVPENVFTVRSALVGAEPLEAVHDMGIWKLRANRDPDCTIDVEPVTVGARAN